MARCITYAQRQRLKKASQDAVLIYNHIPKCGGLSLTHMLRSCYAHGCDVHQNIFEPRAMLLPQQGVFYHGHGVSGIEHYFPEDTEYFYITVLRHPWTLAQSLVRFFSWLTPLDPLYQQDPEKLLLLQEPNILVRYLGNGDAALAEENLLYKYVFFGLQEFFPASLTLLAQDIPALKGVKSVTKNVSTKEKWHISESTKEQFYERNAADMALYAKAKVEFLLRAGLKAEQNSGLTFVSTKGSTATLPSSNTTGDNLTTVYNLKQSIALNEDLPAMDIQGARFENWLHIALHSMTNEAELTHFYHWLRARAQSRVSCLYFAFKAAQKCFCLHDEAIALAPKLFDLCAQRDPKDTCRIIVECRLEIIDFCLQKDIFSTDRTFACTAYVWLARLAACQSPWQELAKNYKSLWENTLSPLSLRMLQSYAQKHPLATL